MPHALISSCLPLFYFITILETCKPKKKKRTMDSRSNDLHGSYSSSSRRKHNFHEDDDDESKQPPSRRNDIDNIAARNGQHLHNKNENIMANISNSSVVDDKPTVDSPTSTRNFIHRNESDDKLGFVRSTSHSSSMADLTTTTFNSSSSSGSSNIHNMSVGRNLEGTKENG